MRSEVLSSRPGLDLKVVQDHFFGGLGLGLDRGIVNVKCR